LWPVSHGQCPAADADPDESISRTPQTEPSAILIDPVPTVTSVLLGVGNAA